MTACSHTSQPCDLADACAWNTGKATEKATACDNFEQRSHGGGGIGCGSCKRRGAGDCAFLCYRQQNRDSLEQMRREVGRDGREDARKTRTVLTA